MQRNFQVTDEEKSVQRLIQNAYESLGNSDIASAMTSLEEALELDFEEAEVIYALKCVNWWMERIKALEEIHLAYDQGGFVLSQWNAFNGFLDRIGSGHEQCIFAIRRYVFSTALLAFQNILGDGVNEHDPGLLLQVGRCYKGIGNYVQALKYFEQAARFKREDGETLAHLADVNALLGETRVAKALFREAFFIDPKGVDLRSLDSEIICLLAGRVRELGYSSPDLEEWIPVYGVLFGVFTVSRELKQAELGRLKQSIFSLENEVRQSSNRNIPAFPRLLKRYFWLLDHLSIPVKNQN